MKIIKNIDKEIIKDDEIEEELELDEEYPLPEKMLYGYYYDNYNDVWEEEDIQINLDKFFGNDFGKVSETQKNKNLANQKEAKGDMVGVYSKGNNRDDDMIIYYDDLDKIIYILLRADFESPKEAWLVGEQKYEEEYGSGRVKTDPKTKEEEPTLAAYGEPGHQLTQAQKESLRETYLQKPEKLLEPEIEKEYTSLKNKKYRGTLTRSESIRLKELEKMVNELLEANELSKAKAEAIHYGAGKAVQQSEIDATKKAISELGEDTVKELQDLADKYNVKYDDVVEKIAEATIIEHKNLKNSIEAVKERIKQPYFFADEEFDPREDKKEKNKLLSIRYNENSIANILSNWLPTISEDIDDGKIDSEELAKSAINLIKNELDTPYVNEKFIPSVKNILSKEKKYDFYKVSELLQYFYNIILKTEGEGVIKLKNSKFDSVKKQLQDSINKLNIKDEKPAWLEEEIIDDIVYSKEWPTTIEEVAEVLMKYGIKDRHEAIGYVKEYLNDNPSELKHFKTTKDSKQVKDSDEFLEQTQQGFEVKTIYADENGRLYAIVYRPLRKDYVVGAGYDINKGYWQQGYYDFQNKTAAIRYLFNQYEDRDFDIYWEK